MNGLIEALLKLGPQLADHILLSAAAIGLGIAVALPLAVWASRNRHVSRLALGFASLVQTIPALALLALFFPILLALRAIFGEGLPTLGFLPAWLALALYALLPILRNAVTALANIDRGVLEAADAMGMTPWQKLRLVQAPLAAPFVIAGIRTASVWTIGAATLATTIGQRSLGDPIFAGLQTQNWVLVLAGCIASAALALLADALFGLIERGLATRRKGLAWAGCVVALLGVGTAALSQADFGDENDTVVIGAKPFSEQYILARVIGMLIEDEGYTIEYREGLGSAVAHSALTSGAVDILVDYSGTLWTNMLGKTDNPGRDEVYQTIAEWEREENGVRVLGRLGFENAYALAMRTARAEALGVKSLADLAPVAPRLVAGGDPEFFERPEWDAVRQAYRLEFADTRNFTATFIYNAVRAGEADVISAYTSDGRIAAFDLTVLEDPQGAFPPYDAILLLGPEVARDERLTAALQPLIGAIDVEAMREANYAVDRSEDKKSPREAAAMLLDEIR